MTKCVCCECGSTRVVISNRTMKSGKRLWFVYCNDCTEEGGDHPSYHEAFTSCHPRPAQARVRGILRGGNIVGGRFCFHGPVSQGFQSVELATVSDLEIHPTPRLTKIKKREKQ